MENTDKLQLSDMIQMLRGELEKSQTQSKSAGIVFRTEKVELELKVAVEGTITGKGGVKFWVINAGGGLEKSNATTHTFKLTLTPLDPETGERADVSKPEKDPAPNI
jgi:hypothetical protein